MNPFDPSRPGMVQTEDADKDCLSMHRFVLSGDVKEAKTCFENLQTKFNFGVVLSKRKQEFPHGTWGPKLDQLGICRRLASDCIRISCMSPAKLAELGSLTAVRKHWAENPPEDDIDQDCGVEDGDTKSAGGADLPKTGEGSSRGARKRKGKRSGGTGPSPKSQQQTLALDPEEAQERMEDDMRRFLRGLADEVEDISERLQYKLRLDTQAAEELRRISRDLLGSLGEFRKIDPPEAAAGFEGRVLEPVKEEWRVLTTLLRVLASVGGKEE